MVIKIITNPILATYQSTPSASSVSCHNGHPITNDKVRTSHGYAFGSGALWSSRYFGGAKLSKHKPSPQEVKNIIHNVFLAHLFPQKITKFGARGQVQGLGQEERGAYCLT